jgi:tripartite-type tricarboxylate transporter receptor subunit TctC
MFSNVSDALPQIQSGAIRPLAVSSDAPVPQLPGVPTVAQSFPGYSAITWNGLMAPAGTPKPIVDKMAAEIAKACKDPKFIEKLATLGADPSGITPNEFADLIARDLKTWAEAVEVAGVKAK